MRNIILTIALLCSFVANAYEPMIREDRIWEYQWEENYYEYGYGPAVRYHNINFRFEGTEEVQGKTYHKLLSWSPNEEKSSLRTVALMREENARVYMLLDKEKLYLEGYNTTTEDFDEYNCKPVKVKPNKNELLLYDFSQNEARSQYLPNNYTEIVTTLGSVWAFDNEVMNAELYLARAFYKDSSITQNARTWNIRTFGLSEERLRDTRIPQYEMQFSYPELYYTEWIIEGIGNVGRGLLHRPFMNNWNSLCSFELEEMNVRFYRQTDLQGNIIFSAPWIEGSGVKVITSPEHKSDGKTYDLSGKEIVNPESGTIYIQNRKKLIVP